MKRSNISDISKKKASLNDFQDKNAITEVLGCLINDPQLLKTYPLRVEDFVDTFHRTLFSVIHNRVRDDAIDIQPSEVETYLKENYPVKYEMFVKHNGIKYMENAAELASPDNFKMNYNTVRKWSLLRELVQSNIDVSEYFDPEEIITDENAEAKRDRFENDSIDTILAFYKSKFLQIANTFTQDTERDRKKAGGRESLNQLELWKASPNFGLSYASQLLTTITYGLRTKRFTIMSAPSGTGKALPNYTMIPTPDGWKQVGDIKPGDYLFGQNGQPTKVLAIHPQKEQKQIWKTTFKDGRVVECCGEHLWEYYCKGHRELVQRVEDIQTIYNRAQNFKDEFKTPDGQYRYKIKLNEAVEYSEKQLAIDPYIFGLLLGDGSFREQPSNKAVQFSTKDEELAIAVANNLELSLKKSSENNYTYYFQKEDGCNYTVTEFLQAYPALINTYSYEKFIPSEYLMGSIKQRMALLQGLLDTDGHISTTKGRISFSTTSEKLCRDVVELCRSLGMIATITEDCRPEKYTQGIAYQINIQYSKDKKTQLFRLKRKQEIAQHYVETNNREESREYLPIINIEPTNQYTDMTCFTVDAEDHLFLCNDFIVTHNTRLSIANMCFSFAPYYWNSKTQQWEPNQHGTTNSALYIGTEMELLEEVEPIIWAYMADVPEEHITQNKYEPGEEERVRQAIEYLRQKDENGKEKNCGIYLEYVPQYDIDTLETIIEEYVTMHGVTAVFFDYIYSNPKLLAEYSSLSKGNFAMREDQALSNLSTKLKELTRKYNISIDTCTQVSGDYKNTENLDETIVRGAKSIIDKCDIGMILTHPTEKDKTQLAPIIRRHESMGKPMPNACLTVYKNRDGKYNKVKVWLNIDYKTMRVHDLYATNKEYEIVPIEKTRVVVDKEGTCHQFTNSEAMEEFKKGNITEDVYKQIKTQEKEDPSFTHKTRADKQRLQQAELDTQEVGFEKESTVKADLDADLANFEF